MKRPAAKRPAAIALLSLLLAGTGLASCASTPADGRTGERLRITLRDYQGGRSFELVSESHSDRVMYYSNVRNSAGRKFQVDAVMAALVSELNGTGFDRFAQNGRAPSSGSGVITRAIEIQTDEEVRHWVVGKGSAVGERTDFYRCMTTFVDLYNVTESFQAIQNETGTEVFREGGRT